jgi:hypothetical protein
MTHTHHAHKYKKIKTKKSKLIDPQDWPRVWLIDPQLASNKIDPQPASNKIDPTSCKMIDTQT